MLRTTTAVATVSLLAFTLGCDNPNPLAPLGPNTTEVVLPNPEALSVIRWEFWLGSPNCISGPCLEPPPRLLGAGGFGDFSILAATNVQHKLNVDMRFPAVDGHVSQVTIENGFKDDPSGALFEREFVQERTDGDSLGSTFSFGTPIFVRTTSGTIRITIVDEGPGVPGGRAVQTVVLQVMTQ